MLLQSIIRHCHDISKADEEGDPQQATPEPDSHKKGKEMQRESKDKLGSKSGVENVADSLNSLERPIGGMSSRREKLKVVS